MTGKAEASSSSQILCLKFLVSCHSLRSINIGSRAVIKRWGPTSLGFTRHIFFVRLANFRLHNLPPLGRGPLESSIG